MKSRVVLNHLFFAALFYVCAIPASSAAPAAQRLNIFTRQQDGIIHFYVQNLEFGTVTATFDVRLSNLKGSAPFPYTATLAGNQTVEAFTLAPIKADAPWNYSYEHASVIGSAAAVPDNEYVYSLPYAPGSAFCVSQGYHGHFSHQGPADEYAIDWRMPVGTPVHAAREGVVVESKDDTDQGGPRRKFEKSANRILIQHPDGTVGIYGHLKQGGNQVKVGDHVKAGDFIALSGNTGFSSGPHLHFAVLKAKDGRERMSLPVKFRSADARVITPEQDHWYTAPRIEPSPDDGAPDLASIQSPAFASAKALASR